MKTIWKRLVWRARYAWRLHTHGGLSIFEAIDYPAPDEIYTFSALRELVGLDSDPIEAADAEITYMREG